MPSRKLTQLDRIVRGTQLPPEAQLSIINNFDEVQVKDMLDNLANDISDDVFDTLASRKLSSETASSLMRVANTPQRIDTVLASEKRATVLNTLLYQQEVSEEQFAKVLTFKKSPTLASALVSYLERHPDIQVDQISLLEWKRATIDPSSFAGCLADSGLDYEDVVALVMADGAKWASKVSKYDRPELEDLLEAYPALLEKFISPEMPIRILSVAAGSHHLNSQELQDRLLERPLSSDEKVSYLWALISLVWNPRTSPDTLAKIKEKVASFTTEAVASPDSASSGILQTASRVEDAYSRVSGNRFIGFAPLSALADEKALQFMVRRNTGNFSRNAVSEKVALLNNPNLSPQQRLELCDEAKSYSSSQPLVEAALAAMSFFDTPEGQEARSDLGLSRVEHVLNSLSDVYDRLLRKKNSSAASSCRVLRSPVPVRSVTIPLEEATVGDLQSLNTAFRATDITSLPESGWTLLFTLLEDAANEDPLGPLVLAAEMIS